ncbi:MAG TPA: hypothetical protein VN282_06025 [Pyrinomonadaceae bacterium]|nr:hypothetical protein [Pyrinomonadaceae bacterium]
MALFRDLDGNFFLIPAEVLEACRVEGELPEGSELAGQEAEAGLTTQASAPNYQWPSPADAVRAQAPSYLWPSAGDAIPTPAPSYIWPSAVIH